jgi:hypothetical protein
MKSNKEKQEGTIRALGDQFVDAIRCVCLVVIEVLASSYTRSCITRIRRVVLSLDLSSCLEIVRLILDKANNWYQSKVEDLKLRLPQGGDRTSASGRVIISGRSDRVETTRTLSWARQQVIVVARSDMEGTARSYHRQGSGRG